MNIDSWKEYKEHATQTMPEHETPVQSLAHGVMGLCGEVGEFRRTEFGDHQNWVDEFGDLWWYLAIVDDSLMHYNTTEIQEYNSPKSYDILVSELANVAEKYVYQEGHGDPKTSEELLGQMSDITRKILYKFSVMSGDDMQKIWEHNIVKLSDRHGDEFSDISKQDRS